MEEHLQLVPQLVIFVKSLLVILVFSQKLRLQSARLIRIPDGWEQRGRDLMANRTSLCTPGWLWSLVHLHAT